MGLDARNGLRQYRNSSKPLEALTPLEGRGDFAGIISAENPSVHRQGLRSDSSILADAIRYRCVGPCAKVRSSLHEGGTSHRRMTVCSSSKVGGIQRSRAIKKGAKARTGRESNNPNGRKGKTPCIQCRKASKGVRLSVFVDFNTGSVV
jgi:hypothetical protein